MSDEHPPSTLSFLQKWGQRFFCTPPKSCAELQRILKEAETNHVIDSHSRLMIESTMQLEKMRVHDVMVPRSKMVMIEFDAQINALLEVVLKSAHSRFPVIDTHNNKIQGVVLAKDLLHFLADAEQNKFDYQDYLREAMLVPESKTLGELLRNFQQQKLHLAIVMDEYGEISGLITLEDVLEQIVGDIEDEHDLAQDDIIESSQGRFLVKAHTPLEAFNEFFEVALTATDTDTIAGLVIAGFTRLPVQFDEIKLQGFNFKVLKTNTRCIHLLEVTRVKDTNKP